MKEHFFKAVLHGVRQIHIPLCYLSVWLAGRAEKLFHLVGEMPCQTHRSVRENLHPLTAPQRLEVTHVELKVAILEPNNLSNFIDVGVFPVGRETHDFAFIAIFSVANEIANHGVKASEGVRQENAVEHLNFSALAARRHGGNKISRTVVAEACRLFPWRAV